MCSFYTLYELVCPVDAMIDTEFTLYNGIGGTFHPTRDKLVLPWSGIGVSWTMEPGTQRRQCNEQIPGIIN